MLRQSLLYLILSILVVVFARYAYILVTYVHWLCVYLNMQLAPAFSSSGFGLLIRKVLVLMLVPLVFAGIPALIYRGIWRRDMPHFIALTWMFWVIVVLSNIVVH